MQSINELRQQQLKQNGHTSTDDFAIHPHAIGHAASSSTMRWSTFLCKIVSIKKQNGQNLKVTAMDDVKNGLKVLSANIYIYFRPHTSRAHCNNIPPM